jgi:DNA-binding beta-propeller fold protein YncE
MRRTLCITVLFVFATACTDASTTDDNPATSTAASSTVPASLRAPEGLAFDGAHHLYVSEYGGAAVDKVDTDGLLTVVAGTGQDGSGADGALATQAQISTPAGIAFGGDGDLLIVDNGNACIREVAGGHLVTIAGTCGLQGSEGDDVPAVDALLSHPLGIAVDPDGGFYFSDNDHGLVRRVDRAGRISSVMGGGDLSPLDVGPGGAPGSELDLGRTAYVILVDGELYVSDLELHVVVRLDGDGIATVVAGTGKSGSSGDGGPATAARLSFPAGLAMDDIGDLYIADSGNNRIRMVDPEGVISTVIGTGDAGYAGDGGAATDAELLAPAGIAFDGMDPSRGLFVADQGNDAIRWVDASGVIHTFAGGA